MKNCGVPENQTTRRMLLIACATALAVALTVSLSQPAHAEHVTPPPVPDQLQVPAGAKAFLEGHAVGTQSYVCLPCPNPTTPAAKLLFSSFVPASPGDGSLSFFGIVFEDARIARVRITSGDAAPGPDDDRKHDIVMSTIVMRAK